jgi:phosphatidylglycerophosphate synthase
LSRIALIIAVAYGVLVKFNPYLLAAAIVIERLVDGLDGYLARLEASNGNLGFFDYLRAVLGNKAMKKKVDSYKDRLNKIAPYGARVDIAGDRAVEYILWVVFAYVHIVPLFVLIIIIVRHSLVDALMGAKGTSSKMKTGLARTIYASNLGRAMINVPKVVAFSYLAFVYIYGWPLWIGYVLIAILVAAILLRGIAEAYEAMATKRAINKVSGKSHTL